MEFAVAQKTVSVLKELILEFRHRNLVGAIPMDHRHSVLVILAVWKREINQSGQHGDAARTFGVMGESENRCAPMFSVAWTCFKTDVLVFSFQLVTNRLGLLFEREDLGSSLCDPPKSLDELLRSDRTSRLSAINSPKSLPLNNGSTEVKL